MWADQAANPPHSGRETTFPSACDRPVVPLRSRRRTGSMSGPERDRGLSSRETENAHKLSVIVDVAQKIERLHLEAEFLERTGQLGRAVIRLKYPGEAGHCLRLLAVGYGGKPRADLWRGWAADTARQNSPRLGPKPLQSELYRLGR